MTEEQNTDIKSDNSSDDEDKIAIDDKSEEVHLDELLSEESLDDNLKNFIESFGPDNATDKQIDDLFEDVELNGMIDIKKSKGKILLLLEAYLSRISSINKEKSKKLLEEREQTIEKHVEQLNEYFHIHKESTKEATRPLSSIKNKFSDINSQSKQDFKTLITKFAIYEVYQIVNPKRIAGESKLANFIHNMIMGGFKQASKYTGGKPNEIKHYNKNFILKLEKIHNILSRRKEVINIDEIIPPSTPQIRSELSKTKGKGIGI